MRHSKTIRSLVQTSSINIDTCVVVVVSSGTTSNPFQRILFQYINSSDYHNELINVYIMYILSGKALEAVVCRAITALF